MKSILLACVVAVFAGNADALSPKASFGVKVVDEENNPLPEMPVISVFSDKTYLGDDCYLIVTNRTGKDDGVAWFRGRAYNGHVDYGMIEKVGCYPIDLIRAHFTNTTGFINEKWIPYDEVKTITLQQIGNPIPLYVRRVTPGRGKDLTTAPDKRFSYDLVKGSWLPPFGSGEHADIEFTLLPREDFGMGVGPSGIPDPSFRDTVSARFLGDGNGVVSFIPPENAVLPLRTAPLAGYKNECSIWYEQTKTMERKSCNDAERYHAFRIRTVKDEHGEIVSALYGKIYRGFSIKFGNSFAPRGVSFTYYLNPTPNDRNLEWNKENLNKNRGTQPDLHLP